MRRVVVGCLIVLSLGLVSGRAAAPPPLDDLRRQFVSPPDDSRIMMRWWWFGPAVTKPELEREMRAMKDGGIGGFEVQPVYPLSLEHNLPFLSDEFLDALRFVSDEAHDLGLRMDLTLGSGWPYGGPSVPITEAAGRLRYEHVALTAGMTRMKVPAIGEGERLLAIFLAPSLREIPLSDVHDGVLTLSAASGDATTAMFFIASRTGMMVKRAAVGAEGFVLDHYDRAAIDHYLDAVGTRLLRPLDAHPPYAIFCDSLEVFQSDWTADLLEEFQRRRGYDLTPHLPALVANIAPVATTAAIRRDWGKTLTELLDERFLTPLHDWAQQHHTRLRLQGYGVPPATISSNALADLPEGEGWQWKQLQATRWASSASHLLGRPVTSSETWTWLHSPVFRATPLDVKAEADLHFLQGINQLIGHGWPYTAEGVTDPAGWRFYAAGVWNDRNPWWIVMPDLARYLQRVSFMLRQGEPANDVALYLPNDDAWSRITGGRAHLLDQLRERLGPDVIGGILDAGFNLDLFDDGTLAPALKTHRVVILPGVETIPLDTLQRLDAFARGGGMVVATRRLPDRAPGFRASDADHQHVHDIATRLFEGTGAPGHFVRDEKTALASTLAGLVQPDVAFSPAAPDIGFVHRRTPDADIYFVANTSNTRQRVQATFRANADDTGAPPASGAIPASPVEIWNPLDGSMTPAPPLPPLALDLDPYSSRLIVISRAASTPTRATRTTTTNAPPPIDISTGWTVTFGSTGTPTLMDHLRSWTDDESTRDFSGVATYERTVALPANALSHGTSIRLDFGEARPLTRDPAARMQAWLDAPVRDAAVVFVNDQRVGAIWCPPYTLDITRALKPDDNRIRLEVANLAVNHLASRALPDYKVLNLRYGVRFEPQEMDKLQPVTSGLLGPIRLIAVR